ncbi:MAG: hypothetical protein HQK70_06335 [Desulfamplus sp.]|nr:hypothetical protein [Desulfamplus sp.]
MLYSTKTLQHRLVIQVTLGLLVFSLLAGIFTYQYSYKHQLKMSLTFQNQLFRTIQSQAEVAVFASNEEIGRDIINGLLTNPLLKGVRIESTELFRVEQTTESEKVSNKESDIDFAKGMSYPLFSPVDGKERIGTLSLVRNNKHIRSEAAKASMTLTLLMLSQLLMAALLIVWVSRRVISKPVSDLANKVVSVKPGENSRITIEQVHANNEIGMLSGGINSFISAAADALSESAAARTVAEAANRARSEFLDNSGEGFLSFGSDMLIAPEYSHECEAIFDNGFKAVINGNNICDLLFGKEPSINKENFQKTLELIFTEPFDLKRELYISLLQPVYQIGEKHVKAKYKLITNDTKMMLILTDITREKILEQHVENERKRLKFVITAVRETRDLFEIIKDFNSFKQDRLPYLAELFKQNFSEKQNSSRETNSNGQISISFAENKERLYEIYRQVHTFKGLFAQQEFLSFPEFLHEMETRISKIIGRLSGLIDNSNNECIDISVDKHNGFNQSSLKDYDDISNLIRDDIKTFVEDFQTEIVLEQDLLIIRQFLGDEFIERKGDVVISSELASKIEAVAVTLISMMGEKIDRETLDILEQVKCLRYVDVKSLLMPNIEGTLRLAKRLGKYISQFQVEGDNVPVHPDTFTPFIRSLVNVFRNAVDHGIEEPDERIEAGKNEYAAIKCKVRKLQGFFEISISDDGRGVDLNAVKKKMVEKGLMTLNELDIISARELLQLLFIDDLSTKNCIDAISGRGMGLSAVKRELQRLNGRVEINTKVGGGTCFNFYIPLS